MEMVCSFSGIMKFSHPPLLFFHQFEAGKYGDLENCMLEMPEPEKRSTSD